MDQRRFDQLSRGVALAGNRRGLLRGTLGAALATVFGATILEDEAAAKKPKGCGNGKKKCGNKCIPKKDCCKDGDCKSGQQCKNGKCKCKGGTKACGNKCIANAGCCNNGDCTNGQTCQSNVCGGCTNSETACAGVCIPAGSCCAATDCPAGTNSCTGDTCTITVTDANRKGWIYWNDLTDVKLEPVFENGPGTPPTGTGSARIQTPTADEKYRLSAPIYNGVPLSTFTELTYSTYVPTGSEGVPASLQLGVDFDPEDGFTGWQGRAAFIPFSETTQTTFDTWQTWDVLGNAAQWFFSGTHPYVPNPCTQVSKCTFAQVLAAYPNIRIHPDELDPNGNSLGFIGMQCGRDFPNQTVYVDALTVQVGDDLPAIYEFEP